MGNKTGISTCLKNAINILIALIKTQNFWRFLLFALQFQASILFREVALEVL